MPVLSQMQGLHLSYEIGHVKPDPQFYLLSAVIGPAFGRSDDQATASARHASDRHAVVRQLNTIADFKRSQNFGLVRVK